MGNAQFDIDDSELIETIKASVLTERFEPEEGEVFSRQLYHVPEKPLTEAIEVASLSGLVDYLNEGIDDGALSGTFVQVGSPSLASVVSEVKDRKERRFTSLIALFTPPQTELLAGRLLGQERAIIELQSCFVDTPARANLIRILGNLLKEEEISQADDGVTQVVATRSGVRVKEDAIVNPIYLQPFRTFTEIEQPASPFIVRLDKNNGVQVSLHCADGGGWKNVARVAIKAYLKANLTVDVPVLA